MVETLSDQLSSSALQETILDAVASESLNQIELEFDDHSRFVIAAVRAVARRDNSGFCTLVYSEAPMPEGRPLGFDRISHMQDGHGKLTGSVILTSRDANNGACKPATENTIDGLMNELEQLGLTDRLTVIWDEAARIATVYPEGIGSETNHARFEVSSDDPEITQDDVCEALDKAYEDNLKNPSGGTAKLWTKGKLISRAEEEIEGHLKGQLAMYYAGQKRPVQVISQTNTNAGRTDLLLIQKPSSEAPPQLSGVVELKVLRGPESADWKSTQEGLSQGFHYCNSLGLPFATLALYDVAEPPSDDLQSLLKEQNEEYLAQVRTRRFPIYNSPKEWRKAQAA